MPTNITAVAQHLLSVPTRPVPGEKVAMETGTAPLAPLFQRLIDNDEFALGAVGARLQWAETFHVEPGGALNSFSITMGAIQFISLVDDGGTSYKSFFYAGGSLTQAKVEGGGGTLGAVAQAWHIYAYNNGGALDFEISTTAPRASGAYKNAAGYAGQSRRYLGTFVTDATGAPIPMSMSRGRCLFRRSAIASVTGLFAANGLRALDVSAAQPVPTDLGLSARVPSTARAVILDIEVLGDPIPFPATLDLFTNADTASAAVTAYSIDHHPVRRRVVVPLAPGSSVVKYTITAAGLVNAYVDLVGWE